MIKMSPKLERLGTLMILVAVLLFIFCTRLILATNGFYGSDEVRLITRAEGSFAQVIAWQPTDWPPLYNLVVSAWWHHISNHPVMLRLVSVFCTMLGLAATYRLGRYLWGGSWAGLGAVVALAALKYYTELSIFVRGYIMALSLFPFVLWLSLRYLDNPRWRRALAVSIAIALMFYTTYISVFAFAVVGIVTFAVHRHKIWHWWLPIIMSFILVSPELMYKYSKLHQRFASGDEANILQLKPLGISVWNILLSTAGPLPLTWLGLSIITMLVLLWKRPRTLAWLFLFLAVAAPFILYASAQAHILYYFHQRYIWWAMLCAALYIGAGIGEMPRKLSIGVLVILTGLMVWNVNQFLGRDDFDDYETYFPKIADEFVAGDVLIRDTNFCSAACGHGHMVWNYYEAYYLGGAIPRVTEPQDARRVWYIRAGDRENDTLEASILEGRIPAHFFGPSRFFTQLYVAPPDPDGVLYNNGMRFHGIDFLDESGDLQTNIVTVNEQTALHVRLWWSIDEPLLQNYSVSIQLFTTEGQRLAQHDGAPQPIHLQPLYQDALPQMMTGWEPRAIYVEDRWLEIPDLDTIYDAHIVIIVYDWRDNTRFNAESVNTDGLLIIPQSIYVRGW